MGSIHLLEQTRHGLYPEAERIYQKAERVTFEHDMVTAPDPAFLENGMGKSLSTQVPTDVFTNTSWAWANLGLDPARLEQLQPWVAAMAIVVTGAARRGIEETHGVVNDPEGAALAAAAGMGLAQVGSNIVLPKVSAGQLVLTLEEHAVQARGLYAVYPSRRFVPRRLTALVAAIVEAFAQRPDLICMR